MKQVTFSSEVERWSYRGANNDASAVRHVCDVLRCWVQRASRSLRGAKKAPLKVPGRSHQFLDRRNWGRRGYGDAQRGLHAYLHQASCQCARCHAYWAGHARYTMGM